MATPALLLLQFRSIQHHLRMAHKLDKQDSVVCYCLFYVTQTGMKIETTSAMIFNLEPKQHDIRQLYWNTNSSWCPQSSIPANIPAEVLHSTVSQRDIQLTSEDSARAQKYSKYAGRALHYEDVTNAVQNLEKGLKLLTI
ncbi:hypothetical protein Celaphus_00007483, partial [Cervus elaphus hippelaphus]